MQGEAMRNGFNAHIPNILSSARLLLAPLFVWGIHDIFVYACTQNLFLLITFTVIITSDIADGFLARRLRCTSTIGARLDVIADAVYTLLSLTAFAHFNIIPVWFVCIMLFKLAEFLATSTLMAGKRKPGPLFFARIGKLSASLAMALPGVFVFRCIITDYKLVMHIIMYIVTLLLIPSFARRLYILHKA
jgi:phosphatidylglycerophosphate synthase